MPSFSDYIIYVDESGDHSLVSVDENYPVFVLAFCIFEKGVYARDVVPQMVEFKFKHFGHDQTVLHEYDIRKQRGDFAHLADLSVRDVFMRDLDDLIEAAPFTVVAVAIRKEDLVTQYADPSNPYHLALAFGLERVYNHLIDLGCGQGTTHAVFEKRGGREEGGKEDRDLELEFRRVCDGSNAKRLPLPFEFVLADKKRNSVGLQIADMVARPIGLHVIRPSQNNRAWELIEPKMRRSPKGEIGGWGVKVFP